MSKLTERENRRKASEIVNMFADTSAAATGRGRPKATRETKKTYSLLFFPSVYEDAKKIAYIECRSLSDVIGAYLTHYIEDNQQKLQQYNNLRGEG